VGVIGMGWMGLVHSRSYRMIADRFSNEGLRPWLVICADDVKARAREAQERFGFEQCTTDWKQVVSHPEVQVVNIASPNHLHLEMVQAPWGPLNRGFAGGSPGEYESSQMTGGSASAIIPLVARFCTR